MSQENLQKQKHKTLATLDREIRDRKRYLAKQEELITQTIDNWNTDLVMLRQEIKEALDEKTSLLREKLRLTQDIRLLQEAAEDLETKVIEMSR